jgi:hypothetical protein
MEHVTHKAGTFPEGGRGPNILWIAVKVEIEMRAET